MISLLLALTLAAAQPQPAATPPPPAKETRAERKRRERAIAEATIVCREITETGRRVPKTVCLSQATWDDIRQDAIDGARGTR